jgi:hypothetical protein
VGGRFGIDLTAVALLTGRAADDDDGLVNAAAERGSTGAGLTVPRGAGDASYLLDTLASADALRRMARSSNTSVGGFGAYPSSEFQQPRDDGRSGDTDRRVCAVDARLRPLDGGEATPSTTTTPSSPSTSPAAAGSASSLPTTRSRLAAS